jgi:hypothetical protein
MRWAMMSNTSATSGVTLGVNVEIGKMELDQERRTSMFDLAELD